jgi:hypothetical protein
MVNECFSKKQYLIPNNTAIGKKKLHLKRFFNLDTHAAFSHTLPSKIIETNRIWISIEESFASPAAAGPKLRDVTIDSQITERRFTYAFDFIGRTWSREGNPG